MNDDDDTFVIVDPSSIPSNVYFVSTLSLHLGSRQLWPTQTKGMRFHSLALPIFLCRTVAWAADPRALGRCVVLTRRHARSQTDALSLHRSDDSREGDTDRTNRIEQIF
jgi:hypothetical protein